MTSPEILRVSSALFVAVTSAGIAIPAHGEQPAVPLGLADLHFLLPLTFGSNRADLDASATAFAVATGGSPANVEALLGELDRRDLLLRDAPPVTEARPRRSPDLTGIRLDDTPLVMPVPLLLRPAVDGFDVFDAEGMVAVTLSPAELFIASTLRVPAPFLELADGQDDVPDAVRLSREALRPVVRALIGAGALAPFNPEDHHGNRESYTLDMIRRTFATRAELIGALNNGIMRHDLAEERRRVNGGKPRLRVVPVDTNFHLPPTGLGMIIAFARALDGGRLDDLYEFYPRWFTDDDGLVAIAERPAVYLFSNYDWTHTENLRLAALVKRLNPRSITIHGGPDTPKYQGDCDRYFADHPEVDITVRGEGEATFAAVLDALNGQLADGPERLAVLTHVAGISFRLGEAIVHTPDRDRIADLDSVPSPVLQGMFDAYGDRAFGALVLETNRGCPYGCTFCDWGSATLSRIRQFDLDRVFAELEWAAVHQVEAVSLADANFGIFERDVAIARHVAALKAKHGFPKHVGTNYAKNTVKHLREIIEIFADAGIVSEGIVSLQSMDTETLHTIRRKNIKVERYNDLSDEFRKNGLPLAVDLMMGLPGSTLASFRNDLQECINRGVRVRVHHTQLLPNSPMNEPSYREEHAIVAKPGELLRQTSTYTRDEWDRMARIRQTFFLGDMFAMLRQVATFVRSETGCREIDFYEGLSDATETDHDRWPVLAFTLRSLHELMVPPTGWRVFIEELRRYCVEVLGIDDSAALATALRVQLALLPAPDRQFPDVIALEHDFVGWFQQILDARERGNRTDWEFVVPRLGAMPPGLLEVDDPENVCVEAMGTSIQALGFNYRSWELGSPLARARMAMREAKLSASASS